LLQKRASPRCSLRANSGHSHPSLWVTYASLAECRVFTIKEATMLKTVVLAMGLMAIPSIAQTQQQQCQLECTWVNGKGEKTRVSRSCHGLNASDCVNLGRAETGGNKTCRGYVGVRPRSLRYYATERHSVMPARFRFTPNSGHGVVTIRSLHPRWRLSLAAPQCRAAAPFEGLGRTRIWSIAEQAGQRAWPP